MIDKPGYITDHVLLLGRRESCVYLLKGTQACAILGGGSIHIIPDILEQLQFFGIDASRIQHLVILHSHFDHVGIIPFFKRRWPWTTVMASARGQSTLQDPRAIASIQMMNQIVLQNYQRQHLMDELQLEFKGLAVEQALCEGDELSCDDLLLRVLEVPGHSSCSIALYLERDKALFTSDAAGIPIGQTIFTAANSNFDKYQASLQKMMRYDIEYLLAEHYGAACGDDAHTFLARSIQAAAETRTILEEVWTRTQDLKQGTEEITDRLMQQVPSDFLPRPVIEIVVGQMLKYIAKQSSTSAG